jgi:hypothetical protein
VNDVELAVESLLRIYKDFLFPEKCLIQFQTASTEFNGEHENAEPYS